LELIRVLKDKWISDEVGIFFMDLIDDRAMEMIGRSIITPLDSGELEAAMEGIEETVAYLYSRIPDEKRVSYGIVHVINTLSDYLFSHVDVPSSLGVFIRMFEEADEERTRLVSLGVMANHGMSSPGEVMMYLEAAAVSEDWITREFSQYFFRRIINARPDEAREMLTEFSRSGDPKMRRFVAETLRPVKENRWFYKDPEYPLSILRGLFMESDRYARTSVGNNLSDLSRRLPELVFSLVGELVSSGDPNSYWIAYRACRNLVKKYPERAMGLLGVSEYKYKKRRYMLNDGHRD